MTEALVTALAAALGGRHRIVLAHPDRRLAHDELPVLGNLLPEGFADAHRPHVMHAALLVFP